MWGFRDSTAWLARQWLMLQRRAMLGEETCLLQDSEWFFRGSWYVYITAHKQMGYELNCITEGCSCLTRGGKKCPPWSFVAGDIRRPHLFKVKHCKRSQPTAGCLHLSLNSPNPVRCFCTNINHVIIQGHVSSRGFFWRMQKQIF